VARKSEAGRPPLGRSAWRCRPLFAAFLLYAPDCLMKSVSVALDRSEVVGGRVSWPRPASLGLSLLGPPIHRRVDQWLHILLIDGFGLGLSRSTACEPIFSWLKPFGLGSCILYETTLDWLAFALMSTLTKDEHETPWGIGRPAWDSSHFGQISYMLYLHSNAHQNLWNSLI